MRILLIPFLSIFLVSPFVQSADKPTASSIKNSAVESAQANPVKSNLVTDTEITKLFIENGCPESSIKFSKISLQTKPNDSEDLIVSCEKDCGAYQCSYSVYLNKKGSFEFVGDFTGRYKILTSTSKNHFNIQVESRSLEAKTVKSVLKFDGSTYL